MTDNTDTQSKITALCEHYLDERTEWDEAPELLGLFTDGQGGVRLVQILLPAELWELDRPPVMLRRYARTVAAFGGPDLPGLVAMAFRCEAFTLSEDAGPQAAETLRRRRAGGSVPPNKDVHGRIEQRLLVAVDTDGHQYTVTADRRTDDSASPAVTKVIPDGQGQSGLIPDALNLLIGVLRPQPGTAPTSR
ncbi:hypothetical protein BIV25_13370 [Streptomyces sp. MUSC 14]|uniref:hypothetical protein n=1 Tax=Streptomyces sp. MUSC 14 TaxID=1354889 RepID=UPI0008F5AA3D|nr:hypothetical protein [Streptomyces sp. MUSC 14]OIJ97791.1 hypothetical protein BIV25_13370 [Streptomyces sp. MUSC 14]